MFMYVWNGLTYLSLSIDINTYETLCEGL